jgi:hypothetical protein
MLGRRCGWTAVVFVGAAVAGVYGCQGIKRPFADGDGSNMQPSEGAANDGGLVPNVNSLLPGPTPEVTLSACEPGEQSLCATIHGASGTCGGRVLVCSRDGDWPPLSACGAGETDLERCDSLAQDEDCDGENNEGCQCAEGATSTCGQVHAALGDCSTRTVTCSADGAWPTADACASAPGTIELCNQDGRDENCDGLVNEPPQCPVFTTLTTGFEYTCGLSTERAVYCWGDNSEGQLGDGTTVDRPLPVRVLENAKEVVAGGRGPTCALLMTGETYCWGSNLFGELGNGTTIPSPSPVLNESLPNATSLAVDQSTGFQCVLLGGGTVACLSHQLQPTAAAPVVGVENAVSIDVGQGYGCALVNNGTVRCWGTNFNGQLGNGTDVAPADGAAVQVLGITDAVQIRMDTTRSCARLGDGRIQCWGFSEPVAGPGGGLGDEAMSFRSFIPVAVAGVTDAIEFDISEEVEAGACAILGDRSVVCWGSEHLAAPVPGGVAARAVYPGLRYTCTWCQNGSLDAAVTTTRGSWGLAL